MRNFLTALAMSVAFSGAASAATVSLGSLTSNDDGSTEIIADTMNGMEWLRWDILADLNYADTLAAIATGGDYEGWALAGLTEAQLFVNSLLGVHNPCNTSQTTGTNCGANPGDVTGLVGENHGATAELAWFLSDNGTGNDVGFLSLSADGTAVNKYNEWASFASSDTFATGGSNDHRSVSWLLYREASSTETLDATSPVPLPAGLPLLLAGLGALGLTRLRRS